MKYDETTICLAGGCFWGMEAPYRRLPGITDVRCGYANGDSAAHADYEDVCTGITGFREAVLVTWDPGKTSLEALLFAFFAVVDVDGAVFGKPADRDDARRMIRVLAGRGHLVHTGVCIAAQGRELCFAATTKVVFDALSDAEIETYIATDDPYDKAGAYGVQGLGALLVERLDGDFFNVMGLPVLRLSRMLERFGVHFFC